MTSNTISSELKVIQMLKTALIFSFGLQLFMTILLVLSYYYDVDRFEYQSWFSSVFIVLLGFTLFASFQHYRSHIPASQVSFSHLILLSVITGLCIGCFSYISYFLEATYIDPEFSQKSLVASQQHWEANNYTDEAIAGQIELSESFHNPAKWGFFSGLFIMGLTTIIGLIIASFATLKRVFKNENYGTI